VVRESEDVDAVLAAARALTRNRTPELHAPAVAAAGIERLLATQRIAATCADCWQVLAEALAARGEEEAARDVLAAGRRTLADAGALAASPGH
jgi:hypothetical protein